MRQGDLVVRKSYGGDVLFYIHSFTPHAALLKGVEYRLMADAPLSDLLPSSPQQAVAREREVGMRASRWLRGLATEKERFASRTKRAEAVAGPAASRYAFFELPGKVLHLDGDQRYLHKCMGLYRQARIPAEGYYVNEAYMADALYQLLPRVNPDIVVLTGHDGLLKNTQTAQNMPAAPNLREPDLSSLSSYKHSHHFVNAVRMARRYERDRDALVIVAGACQSHFEALMEAGANFASSPGRVLIHALDPFYIAAKVAYTPIRETVDMRSVLDQTFSGLEGMGGLETRGCYRIGLPKIVPTG